MKRIKLVGIVACTLALGLSSCKKTENKDTKVMTDIPVIRVQDATEREV